ncbi:MAG TPA: TonB-dependent receptor, partial [Candidatus Solibacter sp.]|nr:TonB-dependent receptor [Candidatus Solibacter sp.]
ITGTITDPSDRAIQNATVTATNLSTGQERTTSTGAAGEYTLSLLPPGSYKATIAAANFRTADITELTVSVTETLTLNRKLELAVQSELLTLVANLDPVQSSVSGMVATSRTVDALPLTSRNYTQILSLAAGVSANITNASAVGNGSQDVAANGMDQSHNNYQMDGVSITPIGSGNSQQGIYPGIGIPSPDAIEEFKIQSAIYDASYGRNPGANVNVVTRSGGNEWHGAAFEFFRNTRLNANSFFENRSGAAKLPLNQNQFGGVAGGPIKKNKLFLFGSYQGTRQKNAVDPAGNSTGATLPPIPAGDRSASGFQKALGAAF